MTITPTHHCPPTANHPPATSYHRRTPASSSEVSGSFEMSNDIEDFATGSVSIKSLDPGWKYCVPFGNGTNKVQCKFCSKIISAGITRANEHLIGVKGKVKRCVKCPEEVRKELGNYQKEKNNIGTKKMSSRASINSGLDVDEEDEVEDESEPRPS